MAKHNKHKRVQNKGINGIQDTSESLAVVRQVGKIRKRAKEVTVLGGVYS
jgi:hypothetical protein